MKKLCVGIVSVLLMAALLFPTSSNAAEGLLLGLAGGVVVPTEGDKDNVGGASYLDLGYGITKNFMVGGYFGGDFGSYKESGISGQHEATVNWSVPYLGVYARFNYPIGESLEPYANIGLGAYIPTASGSGEWSWVDAHGVTHHESINVKGSDDAEFGLKVGGGLNWFLGKSKKWFIGPEIAYHWVNDGGLFEGMFKFGYQWKK